MGIWVVFASCQLRIPASPQSSDVVSLLVAANVFHLRYLLVIVFVPVLAKLHLPGVGFAADVDVDPTGSLGVFEGIEDFFVDEREPRRLPFFFPFLRRGSEFGLHWFAANDQVEIDLFVSAQHGSFGVGTEQIHGDSLRRIIMRQFAVIFLAAKFDQMPLVRSFARVIVMRCA